MQSERPGKQAALKLSKTWILSLTLWNMHGSIVAVVVLVAAICSLVDHVGAQQDDIVRVNEGLVVGVRRPNSRFFKGIPYAEPPLRDLRFRPPVPHAPWTGESN